MVINRVGELLLDLNRSTQKFHMQQVFVDYVSENLLSIRQFANAGFETVFLRDSVLHSPPGTLKPSSLPSLLIGSSEGALWYFD